MILWLADSGAQGHLLISIGTLRLAAPIFWRTTSKVVVDCGLTPEAREFLLTLGAEGLYVFPLDTIGLQQSEDDTFAPGIIAMRARIEASLFVAELCARGGLPYSDHCLVCDADTVFLREFECPRPALGTDLIIMQEWDNRTGVDEPMLLMRRSTFAVPLDQVLMASLSRSIELPDRVLLSMPTYNTGVFGFNIGSSFSAPWREEYHRLLSQHDELGRRIFSLYAAEQNALALAIVRGTVVRSTLKRRFNQFPPRPPGRWPEDTVIGHFISFRSNHREERYSLWFSAHEAVRVSGWAPPELLSKLGQRAADSQPG